MPFRVGPIPPNLVASGLSGQRGNQCTDQTIHMRGMVIFAGRQGKATSQPALLAVKTYSRKTSILTITGWDCGDLLCSEVILPTEHAGCASPEKSIEIGAPTAARNFSATRLQGHETCPGLRRQNIVMVTESASIVQQPQDQARPQLTRRFLSFPGRVLNLLNGRRGSNYFVHNI